jgi:catechol 2,3-dioxygenase-like lactoylglutathione lyase family enzyme
MDYRIEVVTLPVSDVDAAKAFYADRLGFAVDVDYAPSPAFRVVQLTPPGSAASIQFGIGLTDAAPGSARSHYLVVPDVEAAREELSARGVEVGGVFHKKDRATWAGEYEDGLDPEHTPYASFLSFDDPDGNNWIVQEIS